MVAGFAALAAGLVFQGGMAVRGQDDADAPAATNGAEVEAGEQALVYRVRADGRTLYLAGSIHLLRKDDYPLPAAYEEAYQDSEAVVLEIVGADQNAPGTQRVMMEKGMLPEGTRLRDVISGEHHAALQRHVAENGLPPDLFDRMRPWLAAMTLAVLEYGKLGASPEYGMDKHFERRAQKDGKPASGLETIEQQLGLLAGLDEKEARQMLEQTLDELDDLEDSGRRLMDAWRAGDSKRLEKLILKDADRYPGVMEKLLFERNARWMEPLAGFLDGDRTVMVIVGAGHLVGEKGLVRLLEAKGFDVEQLGIGAEAVKGTPQPVR